MSALRIILALLLPMALLGCDPADPGEEGQAQIRVTTVPEGAAIACDGVPHDVSPLTLAGLQPGAHLLVASKEGYIEARESVSVLADQRMAIEMKLDPLYGLLLIHSTPSDAEVEMDGAFRGKTPLLVPECPMGTHRFHLRKEGFLDKEMEVTVSDRIPERLDVALRSDTASLKVTSEPAGANVLVDGASRGVTPLAIKDVPSGESTVELRLHGYHPHSETLTLTAGDDRNVTATLKPVLGGMKVVSIPTGGRVYIDNQFRGTTPLTVEGMMPGQHRVRVEARGYEADARGVDVPPKGVVNEEFRLIKNSGLLIITTEPAGVKVFVDGELMGTTPGAEGAPISDPLEVDLLSEGRHILQLSRKGYARKPKTVTIRPEQVVTLHEELARLFIPDTIVRIGDGANDVRKGVLLEKSLRGDIKLEVSRGVIIEIKAENIREIRPIAQPEP